MWAVALGDSSNDYGYHIAVDSAGNSYTVGGFTDTVDFNPGAGIHLIASGQSARNGFILKLNPSGGFVWADGITGFGDVSFQGINLDRFANVYVTGNLMFTADFDPSSATYNLYSDLGTDLIVAKYTSAGNFDWAKNIGGNASVAGAYSTAIVTDEFYNVYTTGGFNPAFDFDPGANVYNLASVVSTIPDIFVLKLGPCVQSFTSQSFTVCQGTPVNVGNHTYYDGGFYTDTLYNTSGCDSIVSTRLTVHPTYDSFRTVYICTGDSLLINGVYQDTAGVYVQIIIDSNGCTNTITTTLWVFAPLNPTVTVDSNKLTADYPASIANFQWLDCNNNYSVIAGATQQVFTPASSGSYAVIVHNINNCTDTSICYAFAGVLPLKLLSFEGTFQHAYNLLRWQTANEVNVSKFIVQRSADRIHFYDIGSVPVKLRNINTYEFTDMNLNNYSVFYYRLKMLDKDGSFTYSKIVVIKSALNQPLFSIVPNPANNFVVISFTTASASAEVSIINPLGSRLLKQSYKTLPKSIRINTQELPSGVYFIEVKANVSTYQQKLLVIQPR